MANVLITPSIIAKESLFQLENNCIAGANVHREYKREFVKIGDTVTIRKPVKFLAVDGAVIAATQDVNELSDTIVINQRKHVAWKFSSQELTMTVEEYSERYIKPAMIVLANAIDLHVLLTGAQGFFHTVGTPGTTPATFLALADAAQKMDDYAIPDDGSRRVILNPAGRWAMANGLGGTGSGGVFNADIVHGMVRRGMLGQIANFDIYGDQNIRRHTVGTFSGTPLVNGATANGAAAIVFDGMVGGVANALRIGDVITLAGVFGVNPVSKETTAELMQFVVTANVTTVAGAGSIPISPALDDGSTTATAPYQNVTALPADNAAITVVGTAATAYPQNLAFHKNALALVTVPLELPDSATFKARADWRGYSIRVIKFYDGINDQETIRLDVQWGSKAIYPDLGVRLWG